MYYLNLTYETPIRWDTAKFLEFSEGGYDAIPSYLVRKLQDIPLSGYYNIEIENERPHLISYVLYGHTQYWWLLMLYNNLLDVKESIKVGTLLKYPSKNSMEDFYFTLNARSKSNL